MLRLIFVNLLCVQTYLKILEGILYEKVGSEDICMALEVIHFDLANLTIIKL